MVYYIVTNWFPGSSADDVAKMYLEERKKYPRDKSLLKVVAECIRSDKKGIKTMGVAEVKEGRLQEALKRQQEILTMYRNIEGYTSTLEVWWNPVEALGMIGMKAPE